MLPRQNHQRTALRFRQNQRLFQLRFPLPLLQKAKQKQSLFMMCQYHRTLLFTLLHSS